MTDYAKLADGVFESVAAYISRTMLPLANRIAEIEEQLTLADAKIAALEMRVEPHYRGTWKSGESYIPGALCTDRGALWFCNAETKSRPGSGPDWTLAVKRGVFSGDRQ